jgi:hypothetical protein
MDRVPSESKSVLKMPHSMNDETLLSRDEMVRARVSLDAWPIWAKQVETARGHAEAAEVSLPCRCGTVTHARQRESAPLRA